MFAFPLEVSLYFDFKTFRFLFLFIHLIFPWHAPDLLTLKRLLHLGHQSKVGHQKSVFVVNSAALIGA